MDKSKIRAIFKYEFRCGTNSLKTVRKIYSVFVEGSYSHSTVSFWFAETYCNQLDNMMKNLSEKQPRLVNRHRPILLRDNARPHTANRTQLKMLELFLETINHPL